MSRRNFLLKDIIVQCPPSDAGITGLDGLALRVSNMEGGLVDLEKVSETIWRHNIVVEIPPFDDTLKIVAQSTVASDLGYIMFTKEDWENPRDNCELKRDFEMNAPGLSLSLHFQILLPLDPLSKSTSATRSPTVSGFEMKRDDAEAIESYTLGLASLHRFKQNGHMSEISEAIKNLQRTVRLTPEDHAHLPTMLDQLGLSFFRRFQGTADANDASEAVINLQRAVLLTPDGHANLPNRLNNLGAAFSRRFERIGQLDDITEAIKNHQCAVRLGADQHTNLPTYLNNLGLSFVNRFIRSGDVNDISEAIKNLQHAVRLISEGHTALPTCLNNLGLSFSRRFERNGDLADISEAIKNHQRAVRITSDGHPNFPTWLNNLGLALLRRSERNGDLDDLSEAIKNQQRAIRLTPKGHANLPTRLNNLSLSLSGRFKRNGDPDDISEAIKNQQRAVRLTPEGHADLPTWLNNLGSYFSRRFEHGENVDDISEAIENLKLSVRLASDEHAGLPVWLDNLGVSYLRRSQYGHGRQADDVSEAIKNHQRSVRLTSDGDAAMPMRLNNLGLSFLHRFEDTGDPADISEAIKNHHGALTRTPDGHPHLPTWFSNLGSSFLRRFECNGDLDDVSEAIKHHQQAIQLTPHGHANLLKWLNNLGASFISRFERSGNPEFLARALSSYRLSATSPTGPPSFRLHAARQWVACSSSLQLLEAYACVIQLVSLLSGLSLTVRRRHEVLIDASPLSLAASAAALWLGRPGKALEWLVEGRCIVWNQINDLRTPLDQLSDRKLADQLYAVSKELESAGSRSQVPREETLSMDDKISLEEQAERHTKLARERDRLISTIREIPGFEDFLQPRTCSDIMDRLPREGTIVIINVHQDRCDALILMAGAGDPLHIPLPEFSYSEADRLAKGLREYLHARGVLPRIGLPLDFDDRVPEIDLVEVLSLLWSLVVWPILDALSFPVATAESKSCDKMPRIWWCPTGPLAFLPIHAAGNYQGTDTVKECLSDFAVSSYIPTLNFLQKSEPDSKEPGEASTGLLIVSQTNTPRMTKIPGAANEAERILTQLEKTRIPSTTLRDQHGTVENVSKAMEKFPSIHLACHASQNTANPLKSSIHLHDGPLELSEIMTKNLPHSNFAFLSACQTSTGDKNLPDEVVHLAAGLLAAGYRSVVGTMWSISDKHGPDLAQLFYEGLLGDATAKGGARIDGTRAARALHRATRRFREKPEVADSPAYLLVWVPYIHIGI